MFCDSIPAKPGQLLILSVLETTRLSVNRALSKDISPRKCSLHFGYVPRGSAFQKLVFASGKICGSLSFVSEQTETAFLHRTVSAMKLSCCRYLRIGVCFDFCLFAKNRKFNLLLVGILQ